MTNRHACIDLTEESDSETQECVSAEDRAGDSPKQWKIMMTKIIIGAYHWWCRDWCYQPQCQWLGEWAGAIKPDQLKFLLRRDVVMPALDRPRTAILAVVEYSQTRIASASNGRSGPALVSTRRLLKLLHALQVR